MARTTQRTHPPSTARRPDMAAELACAAAACSAAVEALVAFPGLGMSEAVEAVRAELSTRSVGSHRSVVAEALSRAAYAHLRSAGPAVDAVLAELAGTEPGARFGTEAAQLGALAAAGIVVGDLSPASLSRYRQRLVVRALERVRALAELRAWVRAGCLREELERRFDAAVVAPATKDEKGSALDRTVGRLTATGVDAEALSWAVITFETTRHTMLVWQQANKLSRTFPDRPAADLFGWGWQGLRTALRSYDPALGFAFSTYACTRISGSIRDGVRSESPIPKRLTTYVRKVVKVEEDLTQALGRAPRLVEVAESLGAELEALHILPRLVPTASIEELTAGDGDRTATPGWLVEQGADPAEAAVRAACTEAIGAALERLPREEADAVRLLLLEDRSVAEARQHTGATARQLRQRKERGLAALAGELSEWADLVRAG